MRTELDRLAAKLASERTGPEAWEPARKLAKELDVFAKRYGSTSYQFSQAHQRVHAEIYRLAFASRVASMLNERLLGLVAIASDLSYAEDRPDEPVVAQHLELIDALASGDPERALLAADAHTAQAAVDALGLS